MVTLEDFRGEWELFFGIIRNPSKDDNSNYILKDEWYLLNRRKGLKGEKNSVT